MTHHSTSITIRDVEIRPVKDQKERDEMYYQRWLVLRAALGMAQGTEQDNHEDTAFHLIALYYNQIIGSARLRELSPELGSIAYVAVLPQFQHQGIGTAIMEKLIEIAQQRSLKRLQLKSRITALSFYKKLGFYEAGEPFDYLGIPHVFMHLDMPFPLMQDGDLLPSI